MSIIKRMRKQRAVYWAATSQITPLGAGTWASPVEILCRWEEVDQRDTIPGVLLSFKATVYVDRDMLHGDYLMLGTLSSSTPSDPRTVASWEVQRFEKLPNLRNTEYLRTTHLAPSHLRLAVFLADGLQAITYKRVTATGVDAGGVYGSTVTSIAIAVAIQDRLSDKEVEKISKQGDFSVIMAPWEIPKYLVAGEPTLVDYFLDQSGVRWNVLEWDDGTIRNSWWRVLARRGT